MTTSLMRISKCLPNFAALLLVVAVPACEKAHNDVSKTAFGPIVESELDIGNVMADRSMFGYGSGEHYVCRYDFDEGKPRKLVTRLQKGDEVYLLTYNRKKIHEIVSGPDNEKPLYLEFKLDCRTERCLVDVIFLENDEVEVAITHLSYGFGFLRFRKNGERYELVSYVDFFYVPEIRERSGFDPKEVGYDPDGVFTLTSTEGVVVTYQAPEIEDIKTRRGDHMIRNGKKSSVSWARFYPPELPDYLKID